MINDINMPGLGDSSPEQLLRPPTRFMSIIIMWQLHAFRRQMGLGSASDRQGQKIRKLATLMLSMSPLTSTDHTKLLLRCVPLNAHTIVALPLPAAATT